MTDDSKCERIYNETLHANTRIYYGYRLGWKNSTDGEDCEPSDEVYYAWETENNNKTSVSGI